jgi:hypothetical protein
MTFWRRAPREVYRVYGEDEYLAEGEHASAEAHLADDGRPGQAWSQATGAQVRAPHSGRLLGLGLLVGVTVGALGLVLLNASHRPRSASPPSASPRSVKASTGSRQAVGGSAAVASDSRQAARAQRHLAVSWRSRIKSPAGSAPSAEPMGSGLPVGSGLRASAYELSESGVAVSRADDEFGFER